MLLPEHDKIKMEGQTPNGRTMHSKIITWNTKLMVNTPNVIFTYWQRNIANGINDRHDTRVCNMPRNKTRLLTAFAQQELYAQSKAKSVPGNLDSLLKIVGIGILENV
jgi:hypothetical protein